MKNEFIISLNEEEAFNYKNIKQGKNFLVSYQDNNQYQVSFLGDLYYRNHLENSYEKTLTNAWIALSLYQQKSIQGLQNLEGEFALVIHDAERRSLIALRDPIGSYPLYWTFHRDALHIGTNLQELARQINAPINGDFLASFLVFPFAFVEVPTEQTAFEGIYRIPPGTCLEFSLPNTVRKHWAWKWEEKIQPIRNLTLEEAGEKFREIFRDAIRERVRGEKVASHLSGGMDSSSVVCLAKDLVTGGNLQTLSLVYQMSSLAKETDYINMVLGGAIEPHFIDGDAALDFDWFPDKIPQHDEPYPALFHLSMERILVERAAKLGVTTILTGGGAELVLEGNRYHLADLLRRGKWRQSLQLARQWAEAKNESLWSIFSELALTPLLPVFFRGGYGKWPELDIYAIPPWIRSDFAAEYWMREKSLTNLRQLYRYPVEESYNQVGLQNAVGNWTDWNLANPLGIHISQPFLDPRFITFCLGLPREFREVPGVVKPLLQSAMKGILPEPIRTRRIKANFNEVYWRGLSKNLSSLEAMVEESAIDRLGIFDKPKLIEVMRQHSLGIGDVRSGSRISLSLAVIAWFDRLQQP